MQVCVFWSGTVCSVVLLHHPSVYHRCFVRTLQYRAHLAPTTANYCDYYGVWLYCMVFLIQQIGDFISSSVHFVCFVCACVCAGRVG